MLFRYNVVFEWTMNNQVLLKKLLVALFTHRTIFYKMLNEFLDNLHREIGSILLCVSNATDDRRVGWNTKNKICFCIPCYVADWMWSRYN